MRRLLGRAMIATMALGALAAGTAAAATSSARSTGLVLPDLEAQVPAELTMKVVHHRSGDHFKLGFRSATINVGAGPLVIEGTRAGRGRMRADQLVTRDDGSTLTRRGIDQLHYIRLPSHQHWHLDAFMRYDLRTFHGFRLVASDEKTGFCLGDRFPVLEFGHLPGQPVPPPFTRYCGKSMPSLHTVKEGISVGYGDAYSPIKEGQDIDITHVPSGRYWLVNRVDPQHHLLERRRSNDASSLLIRITRRRIGRSTVRVNVRGLRACFLHATCGPGATPPARADHGKGR